MAWLTVRRPGPLQRVLEACHTHVGALPGVVVALAIVWVTVRVALPLYQTTASLLFAYALLFLALRGPLGPGAANALALAVTAVANTQANRWLTFGLRGRENLLRQHAMGAAVYVLTLGLTSGALLVMHVLDAHPSRVVELAVLIVASACATVTRFVALRSWVFARRARRSLTPAVTAIARAGS